MNSEKRHIAELSCDSAENSAPCGFQAENPISAQYPQGFGADDLRVQLCQDVPYVRQETPLEKEHPRNAAGTRKIPLTRGLFALIDEADYDQVAAFNWRADSNPKNKTVYAFRTFLLPNGKERKVFMHRFILGGPLLNDHRDGNGLNNTRENLRPATVAENNRNVGKRLDGGTSRFKGVCWSPRIQRFRAQIGYNNRRIQIGAFKIEVDAAWAYDREARLRFGAFARCNFPPPPMVVSWGTP